MPCGLTIGDAEVKGLGKLPPPAWIKFEDSARKAALLSANIRGRDQAEQLSGVEEQKCINNNRWRNCGGQGILRRSTLCRMQTVFWSRLADGQDVSSVDCGGP